MDYLYSQVRKMIEEELDFVREAQSMQQIARNLQGETGMVIPDVHPAWSTSRVLTTTWHEGVKISNLEQLDTWQVNRRDLAERLLRAYCQMVFTDGFYHADPHPGNILVKSDGTLVLLDFGATGRLSPTMREGIPQLIEAAVKNDTEGMVNACRSMGFLADGREAELMAEKMITALRNFLQNEVQFEGLNFKDIKVKPFDNSLFQLIQDIGFSGISSTVQVPKDYVLLNRMLTLLLGLCNSLDPKLNPLDVVRPYAQNFVLGQRGDLVTFVRKPAPKHAHEYPGVARRTPADNAKSPARPIGNAQSRCARQCATAVFGRSSGVICLAGTCYRCGGVVVVHLRGYRHGSLCLWCGSRLCPVICAGLAPRRAAMAPDGIVMYRRDLSRRTRQRRDNPAATKNFSSRMRGGINPAGTAKPVPCAPYAVEMAFYGTRYPLADSSPAPLFRYCATPQSAATATTTTARYGHSKTLERRRGRLH
jgi:hypothetical protein